MSKSEIKFLLKHSSIYGLGTIAGQAAGFLLLPFYTSYLTPSDYGVAAIVEITMGLAGITIASGITNSMTRFYYDFEDQQKRNLVVSTLYWMIWTFSALSFAILYPSTHALSKLLFHTEDYVKLIKVAILALGFGITIDVGLLYYRIKGHSLKFVGISLSSLLLSIGLNVYFIAFLGTGLIGIYYSMLVNRIIFIFMITVPILWKVGVRFSRNLAVSMLKFSYPLVFSNIFRAFVNESDKYFINYFFSPFETGVYTIANKIGTSLHLLITSPFLQSYIPRRFEIMNQKDAKESYSAILNYYLLIIGSAGLCLSIFADELIKLMTTEGYYEAARYIPLIVSSWIVFGMRYHFETGILISKETKYFIYLNAFTSFINVALNILLISKFKIWGALVALNLSQVITTGLFYLISQHFYRIKFDMLFVLKFFISLICFYSISVLISTHNVLISLLAKVLLISLYFVFILLMGWIDKGVFETVKRGYVRVSAIFFQKGIIR